MMLTTASVTNVPAGGDLQAAINAAGCGDTLVLQAGADYTGDFILPAKGCTTYITIKSSGYDQMPVRGFYDRVPSDATKALMAHVHSATWTEATFGTALGAGYYKLLGMDISPNPSGQNYGIVELGESGSTQDTVEKVAHHLIVDKNWIHGAETQEVQRCVALNSADTEVTNNWITGCHGKGYDTQAIAGWNGVGRYKIINNYLEGAGENTMFGGATGGLTGSATGYTISDIEFRRNYSYKPPAWRGVWTVKNLFELKNARRVVVDGCVFENNWTDAQAGNAVQFTPRPSDSGPAAVIEDVQFTNNIIRNSGQGMNFLGIDNPPQPQDVRLKRVRVANNVLENINGPEFGSSGHLFTVINGTDSVTIENNTAIHTGVVVLSDYLPSTNFIFRNNISRHNNYGIFGSGMGVGNVSIAHYFPGSVITGNVMAHEMGDEIPANLAPLYPAGNAFPATFTEVFSDLSKYQVAPAYTGKGADYAAILVAQGGGSAPTPTPATTPTPTPTATATPTPAPVPTATPQASPIAPCQPTAWPNSVNGQNSQMQTRRAEGCYPVQRTNNGMNYARP